MASILQSVLTSLLDNTAQETTEEETTSETQASPDNAASSNGTSTAVVSAKRKTIVKKPLPTNLTGLIKLLFSFGAMRDWIKLLIIGGFVESCRRLTAVLYRKIIESFFITANFQEGDDAYDWIMVWLAKRPSWAQAREVEVSTRSFGLSGANRAVMIPGDEDETSALLSGSSKKLSYLPSMSATYSLWHKGHWIQVTRSEKQKTYYSTEETLSMQILARNHTFLNDILLEAKREYLAAQEHNISIYVSDSTNSWRYVASRPKRPLKSIILDPGIKDLLVDDARDFLQSKQWYAARGIPFRRGYLLYGAPGSGKTSIIHSMAGELGLDVYIISLSRAGLDDTGLNELISELPEKCIALMEDIDAAFHQVLNRGDLDNDDDDDDDEKAPPAPDAPPAAGSRTSRISLSGLLNALDGVGAQEGRILYATTNKYQSLDPALCRPGRMDIHVEFKLSSRYQAKELFRGFYLPDDEAEEKEEAKADEPAKEGEKKEDAVDSGYSTKSNSTPEDTPNPPSSPSALTTDLPATATASSSKGKEKEVEGPSQSAKAVPAAAFFGNSHWTRGPKLTKTQVADLAIQFSESIPERQISMASLQGYLMGYKIRPFDAVKEAAAWVEKELADRVKRQKKEQEKEERKRKKAEAKKLEEEKKAAEEKAKKEAKEGETKESETKEDKDKDKESEVKEEPKSDSAPVSSS